MTDHTILTRKAYEELKKELEYLKSVKRGEIAQALEYARSLGDLRENAEYQEAREAQAQLEERIRTIEETLRTAEIVEEEHAATSSTVRVGSRVRIQKEGASEEKELTIVSPHEADALSGKISYESPLGAALLGAKAGDTVTVQAPAGPVRYRVTAVE